MACSSATFSSSHFGTLPSSSFPTSPLFCRASNSAGHAFSFNRVTDLTSFPSTTHFSFVPLSGASFRSPDAVSSPAAAAMAVSAAS